MAHLGAGLYSAVDCYRLMIAKILINYLIKQIKIKITVRKLVRYAFILTTSKLKGRHIAISVDR